MEKDIIIREYRRNDKDSIVGLLRLNTPTYFSQKEEKELIQYLEKEIELYFVMEMDKKVIGCGGINFSWEDNLGKLSWDIFHPEFQRIGLGSKLLNYRMEQMKEIKDVQKIKVRTSQMAYKFYEKNGFQLLKIEEGFWAEGFHLYEMEFSDK